MKKQKQLNLKGFQSDSGFIAHYQKLVKDVVIPYQYKVLNDEIYGVEKSHVVKNFVNAGKILSGQKIQSKEDDFYGMVFQDSDAAKWIEACAYALVLFPDAQLESQVDSLIDIIANAQDADGYLDTYFTIKNQERRWKNLCEAHELYCAGHMMEAAVAYFETTGKAKLLKVMEKNAEHIYTHFITNGAKGYPGHPEVELALLKMYRATGNKHCLELSIHFIDVRGVDPHFYEKEEKERDFKIWGNDTSAYDYAHNGKPVREQSDATGHSVRAVYLYTAMADLASETDDVDLQKACRRLWESITKRRMYVTGGIGSTVLGEAFTVDYDLPNDTAYAETCASIGLIFFASRMLELEINGDYADVMERAFYNTVLGGMQLDGQRFFYVNPLEVLPGISGIAPTHKHDLPERPGWYACACCPPNVARLLSSFAQYAYGENKDTVFCHLFAEGEINFQNGVSMRCKTEYPYDFTIRYLIKKGGKSMAIHIPNWSQSYQVLINKQEITLKLENGYVYTPVLSDQDEVTIILDSTPHFIYASTKIARDTGCAALSRGPLVYCFEGIDNEQDVLSLSIKGKQEAIVESFNPSLLNGTCRLLVPALKNVSTDDNCLYSLNAPKRISYMATAIPYYTWGNRGENQMRVFLPVSEC